ERRRAVLDHAARRRLPGGSELRRAPVRHGRGRRARPEVPRAHRLARGYWARDARGEHQGRRGLLRRLQHPRQRGDGSAAPPRRRDHHDLDEARTGLRIEVEDYREVGERVIALGMLRGAGMYSHIEVVSQFATVFVIRNSQILVVDSYDNWNAGLEAAGLEK